MKIQAFREYLIEKLKQQSLTEGMRFNLNDKSDNSLQFNMKHSYIQIDIDKFLQNINDYVINAESNKEELSELIKTIEAWRDKAGADAVTYQHESEIIPIWK